MLAAALKKSFDLYTLPARFVCHQTGKNLDYLRKLYNKPPYGKPQGYRPKASPSQEDLLLFACQQLGIDAAALSSEQRRHKAEAALANVEHGLTLALREGTKALLLIALSDYKPVKKPSSNTLEGEYERVQTK